MLKVFGDWLLEKDLGSSPRGAKALPKFVWVAYV